MGMSLSFKHLVKAAGDDAKIAGTGVRVYTLLAAYEIGEAPEYIAEQRDLPLAAVFEALAYAAEHPEEMEAVRREDEAAERRVIAHLPKGLRREAEMVLDLHERSSQELIRRTREALLGTPVPCRVPARSRPDPCAPCSGPSGVSHL